MKYKDTLLMPQTKFEMKGNLKEKDPIYIKLWNEKKIYEKLSNREGDDFILHDGPPYANGDIHVGHALNKILKDIVIRNSALNGKKIDWRVGWDTHGLPIEIKVQQLGIKILEVGKDKYIEECTSYALSQVAKQQEQFNKLALLTDFDKKYLTLNKDFEARQIKVFHKMINKNLIYQDLKPVYWSWSSKTALADAEIEYSNLEDNSIYVKFKYELSDFYFVIWTTTPWTLPANVAISFGEKIKYVLVECENEKYIIANNLVNDFSIKIKKEIIILKEININEYIGKNSINPINGKKSKLVWGHHVTTDDGTGIVHIAGGHGHDDYLIVKANNLDLFVVIDDKGHMINVDEELNGIFYLKANDLIIERLNSNNNLVHHSKFIHSVPIDWRTKKPVIYRATKQWFVSIKSIKNDLIKAIKNVTWYPSWGEERLIKMIENRLDWCISRQRIWGVPIPIIYDENKLPIIDKELQINIENAFEKYGILAWHNIDIKNILPPHIKYNELMKKEMDILDVWFDSGTSHELLGNKKADLYFEGNDQYRGWFNSSLITSFVTKGFAPYKTVITHGFVNDEKGNKMSKSLGNTINPMNIIKEYGVDILRLWVASSDYQDNIKISNDAIKQISNDYRKIRNSLRFILGNLFDYNIDQNDEYKKELNELNKVILNNLKISFDKINEKYSKYEFIHVVKELMNELNKGSISYLLDYSKDILYVKNSNDLERRGLQYTLNEIFKYISFVVAPIIPITIEEAWTTINENQSFFTTIKPKFLIYETDKNWKEFELIKEIVNKKIEILRENKIIKTSQEVEIDLSLTSDLIKWKNKLNEYLMVAKVNIIEDSEIKVKAFKFNGFKCERCWKYFDQNKMDEDICKSCNNVLKILEK